jgi:hypothetical protein
MAGLEKGEINISPFNELRLELEFHLQTEMKSGRSLNRWFISFQARTSLKKGIENFL